MVRRCPSGGAPAPAGEPSCGSGRPRILLSPMTLLADLEEFVRDDRPHGPLTPHATEAGGMAICSPSPAAGWRLSLITHEDAELDLLRAASLN